jgi:hypothetical protein
MARCQDGFKTFFFLLLARVLDVLGLVTDFPWDIRILYFWNLLLMEVPFSSSLVVCFGSSANAPKVVSLPF